jgi:hypothetical protein
MRGANTPGEFPLEGGDLGPLSDPAGEDYTPNGIRFLFIEERFCDWNHK